MPQDFSIYREPAEYHHSHLRDNVSTSGSRYAPPASHVYSDRASAQTFANSSPTPYPEQYRTREEYISTLDSTIPIQQKEQQTVYNRQVQAQAQQQQQMYQQQGYAPSSHPLSSQVAGPSVYRRPSANGVPSSLAIPDYHDGQSSENVGITQGVNGQGGVERRDKGNRMIDADVEGDGRVGVEDPREFFFALEYSSLAD